MTSIIPNRTRFFTILSIIAFTWVILGDLVAMHINVICDIDVYNHQPFGKTQKSNEKCIKGKKGTSDSDIYFLDLFTPEKTDFSFNNSEFAQIVFSKQLNFNPYSVIINSPGRSPPFFSL